MRVLWFTNTPSAAIEVLSQTHTHAAGWISSLDRAVSQREDVELGVAFPWHEEKASEFVHHRTRYFTFEPIGVHGKISALVARWKHLRESEREVDLYLQIVDKFQPDIVHIFGTERPYGLMIERTTKPVVIHIQGNMNAVRNKWFSGIPAHELLRYSNVKDLLKARGLLHDYFGAVKKAAMERRIYRGCSYFMGRTAWDRRLARILAPKATYYHCDEMLRDVFRSTVWNEHGARTEWKIVSIIRGDVYKGLETIYAAAQFLESALGAPFAWLVPGISEDDEIAQIVAKKLRGRASSNSVRLLGSLGENDLIASLCDADLFVHPSHIDNSPNSLCEAMAVGLPIVSTSVGGVPSLLRDGSEGVLVQDGDPYGMAGAIIELLNDRDLAVRLGHRARERALERHRPEKIVNDVVGVYADILERERGSQFQGRTK